MRTWKPNFLLFLFIVMAACTRSNPAATCPAGICVDPAFPFCDSTGLIGGTPGRCLAVDCTAGEIGACNGDTALVCNAAGDSFDSMGCPAGCDPSSGCLPFCTASQVLSCTGDDLVTCNSQGTATTTETCPLGCSANEARCLTFEPSNGLGPAFADAANEPDVVLPFGARIDTDTGLVQDAGGNAIAVKTTQLAQAGVASIRVLEAKSFEISSVTITGTAAIAFVAPGPIKITDRITARAVRTTDGPGARTSGTCLGNDVNQFDCTCNPDCSVGAGGGGNAQVGGRGGADNQAAGSVLTGFSPLAGGCTGGLQRSDTGATIIARGGGGGGAIQIVSGTIVELSEQGLIDVGGGGGQSTAGGGSGGNVVIEAPSVTINGSLAGVVANGGAGGGCGMTGADATITTNPALGATCANYFAGAGGAGTTGPTGGCRIGLDSCMSVCPVVYGGGGGASGRMRIATRDGTFVTNGTPTMSVVITAVPLAPL